MDIRKVKKLIELLEESNIGEIEIKEGEESVRISRQGTAPAPMAYAPAPAAPAAQPAPAAAPAAEAPAPESAAPAPAIDNAVLSPMVGTFYRAPGPDAAAFVEVGDYDALTKRMTVSPPDCAPVLPPYVTHATHDSRL